MILPYLALPFRNADFNIVKFIVILLVCYCLRF